MDHKFLTDQVGGTTTATIGFKRLSNFKNVNLLLFKVNHDRTIEI